MSNAHDRVEPNDPTPTLSPAGEMRRVAILALAEGALRRRVRRRRLRRTAFATAGFAAVIGVIAIVLPQRPQPSVAPIVQAPQPPEPVPPPLDLPYAFAVIDDDELLRELESAGVGLVQIGSEAPRLVTADGQPYEGLPARERSPG
jgi:hypothetical protein